MIRGTRSDLYCCGILDAVIVVAKWSLIIALSMNHFDHPAAVWEQREGFERHTVIMRSGSGPVSLQNIGRTTNIFAVRSLIVQLFVSLSPSPNNTSRLAASLPSTKLDERLSSLSSSSSSFHPPRHE